MAALAEEIQSNRDGAEIYHGGVQCRQICHKLLEEFSLPKGLMPLDDIEELGFNRSTGFFWLNHKKKKEHVFKKIGQTTFYDMQVTAFIEQCRLKKVTGVKAKDLMVTVTVRDIFIEDPNSRKITFKTTLGLARSHPISVFELEDEKTDTATGEK